MSNIELLGTAGHIHRILIPLFHSNERFKRAHRSTSGEGASMKNQKSVGFVPGYRLRNVFDELKQRVNSRGGALDQSFLYLDYESSSNWAEVCKEFSFFSVFNELPTEWLMSTILYHLAENPHFDQEHISFVGLGTGDGRNEIQLIGSLLNKKALRATFHLVDISHYLLAIAYEEACSMLGRKDVEIVPHEGSFHQLHHIQDVFAGNASSTRNQPRSLRVATLFGNTFGNLTQEQTFIQDSLSAFEKGDLLVADIGLVYAPAEDEAEVRRHDPRFSTYSGQEMWENWVAGPLFRYREDAKTIKLDSTFENHGSIPGSYTASIRATVDDNTTFTLIRVRRYEEAKLIEGLANMGWRSLGGKYLGERKKRLVLVLEKQ